MTTKQQLKPRLISGKMPYTEAQAICTGIIVEMVAERIEKARKQKLAANK